MDCRAELNLEVSLLAELKAWLLRYEASAPLIYSSARGVARVKKVMPRDPEGREICEIQMSFFDNWKV